MRLNLVGCGGSTRSCFKRAEQQKRFFLGFSVLFAKRQADSASVCSKRLSNHNHERI
jgi:hypothetical protein